MRAFSVLLLVCASFAFARAAKSPPVLLSDRLQQRWTAAAAVNAKPASAAAAYYEEAEYEWGCLKQSSWGQCRCVGCIDYCFAGDCNGPGCCQTRYYQSMLACCNKDDYGHESDDNLDGLLANIDIGMCEITDQRFSGNLPVIVVEGEVFRIGTFAAECTLKQGEQCGHPFCDSMVLSWKGSILQVLAASKTNPASPEPTNCDAFGFGRKTAGDRQQGPQPELPQKLKDALRSRTSTKKAGAAELAYSRDGGATDTYYLSIAQVYEGAVTVSSRNYNLKYSSGFMDYISKWSDTVATQVTAAEVEGLHMVEPYTYTLKVVKNGGSYKQ